MDNKYCPLSMTRESLRECDQNCKFYEDGQCLLVAFLKSQLI